MRQVPHYVIIGNGRVARHFLHYFSLLKLSVSLWHRGLSVNQLKDQLELATHALILINDQYIEEFVTTALTQQHLIKIHFSGSLVSNTIYGVHPLMTFGHSLYTLNEYQAIPFVVDEDAPHFSELLPGLSNQHVRLPKTQKAKYHALCVLSGNFTGMLWKKFFTSMQQEFNFPASIGQAYLSQQFANILQDPHSAMTGPLVRNDQATIEKNIAALANDPFQEVYQSFVSCYQRIQKGEE